MKDNSNQPAFPANAAEQGLTKREWMAAQMLVGLGNWNPAVHDAAIQVGSVEWHIHTRRLRAEYAVAQADILLSILEDTA